MVDGVTAGWNLITVRSFHENTTTNTAIHQGTEEGIGQPLTSCAV